jgi:hypothetical protein
MLMDSDDDLFPVLPPPRVHRPAGPEDLAATVAFTVVLVSVGIVLSFVAVLELMRVAACGSAASICDFALAGAAIWITPAATLVSIALVTVALVRRPQRRRRTWWVPVLGVGVTIGGFALASLLIVQALPVAP